MAAHLVSPNERFKGVTVARIANVVVASGSRNLIRHRAPHARSARSIDFGCLAVLAADRFTVTLLHDVGT
jgi:hypothetical protein